MKVTLIFLILLVAIPVSTGAATDTLRVMAVGNSITLGSIGCSQYTCNNTRKRLYDTLKAALSRPVDFVGPNTDNLCGAGRGHCGYGGNMINEIMTHLYPATYRPNLFVIHAGANDVYKRGLLRSVPVDSYLQDLDSMVTRCHRYSATARICVAAHIPFNEFTTTCKSGYSTAAGAQMNVLVRAYNKGLYRLVIRHRLEGWPIFYVNHYAGFKRFGGTGVLTNDGIHPNDSGYHVMSTTWFPSASADTIRWDRDCPLTVSGLDTLPLPETGLKAIYHGTSDSAWISGEMVTALPTGFLEGGIAPVVLSGPARKVGFLDLAGGSVSLFLPASSDTTVVFQKSGDTLWKPRPHVRIGSAYFRVDSVREEGVWAFSNRGSVAAKEGRGALPAFAIHCRPSPFRNAVHIGFGGADGPIRITILSVNGAPLRSMDSPAKNAGEAIWDGRDEQGRIIPAGAYLVRVSHESRTFFRTLILLR